jgi:hypothetical protein
VETKAAQTQSVFQKWLDSLKERDSELQEELVSRLEQRVVTPETVRANESGLTLENVSPGIDLRAVALETIVREGRPALLIRENRIAQQDTRKAYHVTSSATLHSDSCNKAKMIRNHIGAIKYFICHYNKVIIGLAESALHL